MDDCMQMVGLFLLGVFVIAILAVALTWESRGAAKLTYCPYCVAVAQTKPPPAHCWRCGGRYDKGLYSMDWDAVNLELFRGYHGRYPDGYTGDPYRPPTEGRRPDPPDDGYRKDRHE